MKTAIAAFAGLALAGCGGDRVVSGGFDVVHIRAEVRVECGAMTDCRLVPPRVEDPYPRWQDVTDPLDVGCGAPVTLGLMDVTLIDRDGTRTPRGQVWTRQYSNTPDDPMLDEIWPAGRRELAAPLYRIGLDGRVDGDEVAGGTLEKRYEMTRTTPTGEQVPSGDTAVETHRIAIERVTLNYIDSHGCKVPTVRGGSY